MKNKSITFAAFLQGTILLTSGVVAFFYASNPAIIAADIRLSNSDGCCTSQSVIVPCRTEGDSLSYFNYFNFSFMQGTMKNYSSTNNSNANVTSNGAKTVLSNENQLDFSKFIEFFNPKCEVEDVISSLEELRLEYLELSLFAASGIFDRDKMICRDNAHPKAHTHVYYIDTLINLMKSL